MNLYIKFQQIFLNSVEVADNLEIRSLRELDGSPGNLKGGGKALTQEMLLSLEWQ